MPHVYLQQVLTPPLVDWIFSSSPGSFAPDEASVPGIVERSPSGCSACRGSRLHAGRGIAMHGHRAAQSSSRSEARLRVNPGPGSRPPALVDFRRNSVRITQKECCSLRSANYPGTP